MTYTTLLFDLDNTLLNYSLSEQRCMKETVLGHELSQHQGFTWETFWPQFGTVNFAYWSARVESGHTINEVLEYSFRDTLLGLGIEASGAKVLADAYWMRFCRACDFEEHAEDTLRLLHKKYKLAIVSNGIGEAQRGRLAAGHVLDYFDALIISDEVGHWKPSKAIFDIALDRLGSKPNETVFIGDSITDDYQGALNAGIDFCYYNSREQTLGIEVNPRYRIHSLLELPALLTASTV